MHIGEKIRFIRTFKCVKQDTMATVLKISQPTYSEQEKSGVIASKHWPAIEKQFNMKKEDIDAANTEAELISMCAGQQHNHNQNVIYVVNLTINGADDNTANTIKKMFADLAKPQGLTGSD